MKGFNRKDSKLTWFPTSMKQPLNIWECQLLFCTNQRRRYILYFHLPTQSKWNNGMVYYLSQGMTGLNVSDN